MAIEIFMPALSPTMEEGTLAKWLVGEGDSVASGDLLAEIETDKATMEFEAVDEGIIGKILIPEGAQGVKVNTPIAILVDEGEEVPASTPATPASSVAKSAALKPAADVPLPAAVTPAASSQGRARIFASPLARRIALQKDLDLSQITGTGPHGRIIKADVEEAVQAPATLPAKVVTAAPTQPATDKPVHGVAQLYQDREYQEINLDGMRKTIAARLTEAKQTVPHFYLRRDIHLDNLLDLRSTLNKQLDSQGIKLSVNDFIIKACASALQQIPDANAVWAGDRILRLSASDVAVAVAIEGGLFTPVLQDAQQKSLSALSAEMKDLAARARARKLMPHEYQGGSFAISNLGMFGIDNFDAVINPPQSAILAVGAGIKKPVVGPDGALSVATVMSVTLSVDHRVIDGALGAQLLDAIVRNLQNPILMLA